MSVWANILNDWGRYAVHKFSKAISGEICMKLKSSGSAALSICNPSSSSPPSHLSNLLYITIFSPFQHTAWASLCRWFEERLWVCNKLNGSSETTTCLSKKTFIKPSSHFLCLFVLLPLCLFYSSTKTAFEYRVSCLLVFSGLSCLI